ncbi:MAG: hypothetical protein RBU37_27120, partial [Myxococcota bacterium]|nr:hypothetical protein [Myxococcota bacterium]
GGGTDHDTESCAAGVCVLVSDAGWEACDGNQTANNGCEVNIFSTTNCGGCGVTCGGGTDHATESCAAGVCVLDCDAGWEDCDGNQSANNGCEGNIYSTTNCGGCGITCGGANAASGCPAGVCNLVCDAGWEDCDGNPANGCEVDIYSTTNCGGCGVTCGGGTDNATESCPAGICTLACDPGWEDCDGDQSADNGCEVDITTTNDCGGCGIICDDTDASAACTAGHCVLTCDANYGNCDDDPSNGCEANLLTNDAHCGFCNNACSGGLSCSAGSCS